ncbi:MAG: hypothetical protein E7548_05460 [Ruminococcaceae bacterium]|nr:hypothetical protein [Oscillospiraceae bacterium]
MLFDLDVFEVINELQNERETTLKEMLDFVENRGVEVSKVKGQASTISDLPQICVLSLETPHCWHWSLYFKGKFYDPEYGVLNDFPPSKRRYFFEIKNT